ncbi:MAG: hypothetical protein AB8G22_11275, partial [Saprospiraceae bacterium]
MNKIFSLTTMLLTLALFNLHAQNNLQLQQPYDIIQQENGTHFYVDAIGNVYQKTTAEIEPTLVSLAASTHNLNTRTITSKASRVVNDELCDATELIVGAACTEPNGDITSATPEPEGFAPSCYLSFENPTPNAVWYKFTAPASGLVMISANYPEVGTAEDLTMTLYQLDGACALENLTELNCITDEVPTGGTEGLPTISTSVTPNETYYVLVTARTLALQGTFCIRVEAFEPPVNDDLCDAIPLTIDADPIVFSNLGATTTEAEQAISPFPNPGDFFGFESWGFNTLIDHSVWFSFVAPENGVVDVDLSGLDVVGNYNSKIAIYEADDCNSISAMNLVTSQAAFGSATFPENPYGLFAIQFQSLINELACLTPGQQYYILVDGDASAFGSEWNDQGRGLIQIKSRQPAPLTSK